MVRGLQALCGRRIRNVEVRQRRVAPGDLEGTVGKRIRSIARRGKFIVMTLDAGVLIVHLGMTGKLLLSGEIKKHTHVLLTLDRGVLLYEDSRQFGRVEFAQALPARVASLGPEPLDVAFDDFAAALRKRKAQMKALLLNQRFLAGIGNIYADEALHRAGIHPRADSARLTKARARRLYDAIRHVLQSAIAAKGSSISDYVDADGNRGSFQAEHRVYQRTGEPCHNCGRAIQRTLVSQRGTHFCAKCQKK